MSSYLSQFNFQFYGPENGKKWVFLHGLMGSAANWRKIISGLESSERILVYDQRGHGKSWKPPTGYAPKDYATDLFHILKELGWGKINLVGHSMGGRNALVFAAQYPELLDRLVIEDIGPDSQQNARDYYQQLFDAVPTPFASKRAAKDFFYNDFFKAFTPRGDPQILGQYLYTNIVEGEDGQADWRFSKQAILESVRAGRDLGHWSELKSLQMPTLLVRGENSLELSKQTFEAMLACNSNIRGIEISDAGHWVHSDQPQGFLSAIKEFSAL